MKKMALVAAALAVSVSMPALAQNNTGYTAAPIYNQGNTTSFYTAPNGGAPVYNNGTNVAPIPMQQMIAGRNAPSYNYGGNNPKPYNLNNNANPMANVTSLGSLTPEQAAYINAQRDAAMQQNAQAMANSFAVTGNQDSAGAPSSYQGGSFSGLYNNPFGTAPEQGQNVQKKRRVVYKERNNPLVEPPRLFNPDQ